MLKYRFSFFSNNRVYCIITVICNHVAKMKSYNLSRELGANIPHRKSYSDQVE